MKNNNKIKEKQKKNLYDFDYESEEEKKLKKKLQADKKSASKRRKKNKKTENKGQATKKPRYDDEIIIGVTEIPKPVTNKKAVEKNREHKAINKINVKDKKQTKKKKEKNKNKNKTNIQDNVHDDYIIEDIYEVRNRELKRKKLMLRILKFSILAILFAMVSPIFNVTNIIVSGNSKLTTAEVISLSGIENNQNIFRISRSHVINNVKQNAYVNTVEIHKSYPGTIEIVVEERVPNFMLQFGNGYVYINNQGYMLEISNEKLTLPIITGYSTSQDSLVAGNRLVEEDLAKLGTAIRIMNAAQSNEISNLITTIDISDSNNYTLYLESERKTVYLGDCSNLETRILYLVGILQNEKEHEGEIFINMNLNTDNPFFREKV